MYYMILHENLCKGSKKIQYMSIVLTYFFILKCVFLDLCVWFCGRIECVWV